MSYKEVEEYLRNKGETLGADTIMYMNILIKQLYRTIRYKETKNV